MPNPAAGFGIADRLGSEADGTRRGQLGTEAFRQQVLPEGQNALAELLQALQFGGALPRLGRGPRGRVVSSVAPGTVTVARTITVPLFSL